MVHANARLTVHGRRLLVERIRFGGRPVAHVAKEMGVSRQCAHRWVQRFDREGWSGLVDRSSRPHQVTNKTSEAVEGRIVGLRRQLRVGRDEIARRTGVAPRTVSRVLARHGVPALAVCDPITGTVIRSSRATTHRYERDVPGDLVHVDVKKIGRIPDGGGWRVHGRAASGRQRDKKVKIGFDYVHAMIDDHTRLAYAEILTDEKGVTCAGFLLRAADWFAGHGISIREVMTDNAFAYRHSVAFADAVAAIGARQVFITPHCPWQNGKVERLNRTLQTEWAYRQAFNSNQQRAQALDPWLDFYNNHRHHHSIGGTPISRLS